MTSGSYWPGTSPDEIEATAGRLYGPLKKAICAVEVQAKAYEDAQHRYITSDLDGWRDATGSDDEALFLKWQAVRRRAEWDAHRFGAGWPHAGA